MTKYDIMFESLQERVNSGELTIEDAEVLNQIAYEKYGDDETEYEEAYEEDSEILEAADLVADGAFTVEEACECFAITEKTGNNAVLKESIKKNKALSKELISGIKKEIKNKNYKKARKDVERIISTLNNMKKPIMKIKTDADDDFLSHVETLATEIAKHVAVEAASLITTILVDSDLDLKRASNNLDKDALKKAATMIGLRSGFSATSHVISYKGGDIKNEYKFKSIDALDDAIIKCEKLKVTIQRKEKFDAFVEKHSKKIKIGAGVAAGIAAAGAIGAAGVAVKKQIQKKKETSNESDEFADKLYE